MVFRQAPSVQSINGKPIIPDPKANSDYAYLGKHTRLTAEQIRDRFAGEYRQAAMQRVDPSEPLPPHPDGGDVLDRTPDPVWSVTHQTVQARQRIVRDNGGFVDQWLGEIAVLAKDRAWLDERIADPRWQDHPARPDAITERDALQAKIADIADSIAWQEAYADRAWQTLTPEERAPVAHMWLTDPQDTRLVTRAWRDQAQFGWKWPRGCYVEAAWFMELPTRLYMDIQHLWQHGPTWLGEPVELTGTPLVIDTRHITS